MAHPKDSPPKDTPWTMNAHQVVEGPWEIWGPDGDRVALVHGNVALDVTAEERAQRIVEAINQQQGPDDKLDEIHGELGGLHIELDLMRRKLNDLRQSAETTGALNLEDDLRDKIEELRVYAKCGITQAERFVRAETDAGHQDAAGNATSKEHRKYWCGKRVARREFLEKMNSLF